MIGELAREITGGTQVTWDGVEIDLAPPWRRLSIRDAVRELGGVADAPRIFEDPVFAAEAALAAGVPAADVLRVLAEAGRRRRGRSPGRVAARRRAARGGARPRGALCRSRDAADRGGSPRVPRVRSHRRSQARPADVPHRVPARGVAARAQERRGTARSATASSCSSHGREIANGFSELNDPDDQRGAVPGPGRAPRPRAPPRPWTTTRTTAARSRSACRRRRARASASIASSCCSTGQPSIRDVILFPLMRPE